MKVLINLNNAVSALTGLGGAQTYAEPALARLNVQLMREGVRVAGAAGARLVSLPDTPVALARLVTRLPLGLAVWAASRKARQASLNARVVELVHEFEHTHQFLTPGESNSGARSQVRLRSRDVESEHHVAL